MKVRKIIEQPNCILFKEMKTCIYKLESGEYVIIHDNSTNKKIIEFDDEKEFAAYIIDYSTKYIEDTRDDRRGVYYRPVENDFYRFLEMAGILAKKNEEG